MVKGDRLLVFAPLQFAHDQDRLLSSAAPVLDAVAGVLRDAAEIEALRIEGHTDGRGGRLHNVQLSQRRAEAVRRYLVAHGVAAGRLSAKGFGPDRPITTDTTAAGRAQNRRVEFVVVRRRPTSDTSPGQG
jgi:outer membrane protein OmpA-like peptidoglycan-associated protein